MIVVIVGTLLSTGCVSKKLFRRTVTDQDQKIEGVQSGVEENERRVTSLKDDTARELNRLDGKTSEAIGIGQKAGTHAALAERLAKGTVLWEATLANDRVKFDLNRSLIKPGSEAALDEVANEIKSIGHRVYVEIQGHTDSTGSENWNQMLGEKRANAVRHYLHEKHQIPLHLIATVSLGESKPVADNTTREGRAQNRRVVIRVLDPVAPLVESEVAQAGSVQSDL
jgi:outer membrane protein OmpA-like peptidoglycan-associated protein